MLIKVGERYINLMHVVYIEPRVLADGDGGLEIRFVDGAAMLLNHDETLIFNSTLSTLNAQAAMQQMQALRGRLGG